MSQLSKANTLLNVPASNSNSNNWDKAMAAFREAISCLSCFPGIEFARDLVDLFVCHVIGLWPLELFEPTEAKQSYNDELDVFTAILPFFSVWGRDE